MICRLEIPYGEKIYAWVEACLIKRVRSCVATTEQELQQSYLYFVEQGSSTLAPTTAVPTVVPTGMVEGCEQGYNLMLGLCYKFYNYSVNQAQAAKLCQKDSASLMSVANDKEDAMFTYGIHLGWFSKGKSNLFWTIWQFAFSLSNLRGQGIMVPHPNWTQPIRQYIVCISTLAFAVFEISVRLLNEMGFSFDDLNEKVWNLVICTAVCQGENYKQLIVIL